MDTMITKMHYREGQRTGFLPQDQRAAWQAISGHRDGVMRVVDLNGGYCDFGDNVKFNFPEGTLGFPIAGNEKYLNSALEVDNGVPFSAGDLAYRCCNVLIALNQLQC
ncbi:hypothetical protein Ancab_018032 [Ancistrocladus abbreviatus]